MDYRTWAKNSYERVRNDGYRGVKHSCWPVYRKAIEQITRFQPAGTNMYEREWDLLVVLDACRLDLLQEVALDYDFVDDVESVWSVNSTTSRWMEETFPHREETHDTTYVCGNPFSESKLDPSSFDELDEVWRRAWEDPGTVPPRAITDATIETMRDGDRERVIAHYMQPHCPFVPRPDLSSTKELESFGGQDHRDVWDLCRDGDVEREALWEGYRENLELVLDDVELLLNNVDASDVAITSDHGNALGGLGIYGHPPNMPHRSIRTVPWVTTEATNRNTHQPTDQYEDAGVSREEQLQALGYV